MDTVPEFHWAFDGDSGGLEERDGGSRGLNGTLHGMTSPLRLGSFEGGHQVLRRRAVIIKGSDYRGFEP